VHARPSRESLKNKALSQKQMPGGDLARNVQTIFFAGE
jgi:hypothetical protein